MQPNPASFRDNDGFVFEQRGKVYRWVNPAYEPHYKKLMDSGLYDALVSQGKLIRHESLSDRKGFEQMQEGRILLPDQIPFISYPYEWCFQQWKEAAQLTLSIAEAALEKGMVLKDASPFNIQFIEGRPVFIDTLSFEIYIEGQPWVAYRQFCESLLAPLLLMHYCHPSANRIFTVYPNGIPLDLLITLLPKRSRWNLNTWLHIFLQAKISGKGKSHKTEAQQFSKKKMQVLLQGLSSFVKSLSLKTQRSTWDDYYTDTILGPAYLEEKAKLVSSFLEGVDYKTVADLGGNDGYFSLLLQKNANLILTLDSDPNCINVLYGQLSKQKIKNILPLNIDLMAPSPAVGWNNEERASIGKRLKVDLVMALALVHHLVIANNVPLNLVARWLQPMGNYLLIEFIPREDEKMQLLLKDREDIFSDYTIENFKKVFGEYFEIMKESVVGTTHRTLFLMKRK